VHITSKLPKVGTTIFTIMSAMAAEHGAINLSQGYPDFSCDPKLHGLVSHYMQTGRNQYAPMAGVIELREAIARLVEDLYGTTYHPEREITVTSGATESIFCAITALVREGDEVIILEPAYDSYIPAIELCGGSPVCVSLEFPDYTINWDKVKKLVNQRTRAIILNTPHNPTGTTISREDMEALQRIIADKDIFVISDEVYEHILFDGKDHQSVSRFPGLVQRSMVISSFGKTLHATGWKVGYCLAPEYLTREFRKVHQYVTFSTSTPFQLAIADYLNQDRETIAHLRTFYQQKRDYFLELMADSRFTPWHSSGTYFQLMSYQQISNEPDKEFARRMTIEKGVACIPVSVFYRFEEDHRVVRFCFAKDDRTLEHAAELLVKV
jgi:methionine transaminase